MGLLATTQEQDDLTVDGAKIVVGDDMTNGMILLRFWHLAKDLSYLETLLNMACLRSWVAGTPRETPSGRSLPGTNEKSYWSSQIEYHPETGFRDALISVVDKLSEIDDDLHDFRVTGGKIEIYIQMPGSINNGDTIESEYLKRLGMLGVDLLIEVFPNT